MKQTIIAIFLSTFLFANEQIPAAPQKKPILLKNGFIHTISNGVINGLRYLTASSMAILGQDVFTNASTG